LLDTANTNYRDTLDLLADSVEAFGAGVRDADGERDEDRATGHSWTPGSDAQHRDTEWTAVYWPAWSLARTRLPRPGRGSRIVRTVLHRR
jgi:hypothetical protein